MAHPRSSLAVALLRAWRSGRRTMWQAMIDEGPAWIAYKVYDMAFVALVMCVLRKFKRLDRWCDFFNWESRPERLDDER